MIIWKNIKKRMKIIIRVKVEEGVRVFFFKQKTAYKIHACDWSSDVCFPISYAALDPTSALQKLSTKDEIGRASCRERV